MHFRPEHAKAGFVLLMTASLALWKATLESWLREGIQVPDALRPECVDQVVPSKTVGF